MFVRIRNMIIDKIQNARYTNNGIKQILSTTSRKRSHGQGWKFPGRRSGDGGVPVGFSRSSVEVPHESRVHNGAVSSLQFRLHKGTHQAVLIGAEFLAHWREWDCNRSSLALGSN